MLYLRHHVYVFQSYWTLLGHIHPVVNRVRASSTERTQSPDDSALSDPKFRPNRLPQCLT
jgi:hypothetical protein